MTTLRSLSLLASLALTVAAAGCSGDSSDSVVLDDTEWIGANSFEVSTVVSASLVHRAAGSYVSLATDKELQAEVIATHISYVKNTMKRNSFQVNLMPDEIKSVDVSVEGDLVTLTYKASVDMVRSQVYGVDVKTPDDLPKKHFEGITIPADPIKVYGRAGKKCASGYGSYILTEYKYYYYFDPDNAGCDIPMTDATIDVVDIYENPIVYPEYDRLLNDLGNGKTGFRAAILPNRGDDDPMGRFDMHRSALNRALGMDPEELDGFHRYNWTKDGATIIVDLFDPTDGSFTNGFYEALGNYQVVYYNGHSNYGHQPFLQNKDAYSDEYQILGMHSCQSYAYYASQMAAGKATPEDPTGFVDSDMIATGRSSYPSDSPDVLVVLLKDLMSGLGAVLADKSELAPSWQAIGERMMDVAPSILYGVAGARNNAWKPAEEPIEECSHDKCETGAALEATCDPCVEKIVAEDLFCTDNFWDELCVEQVESVCGLSCG